MHGLPALAHLQTCVHPCNTLLASCQCLSNLAMRLRAGTPFLSPPSAAALQLRHYGVPATEPSTPEHKTAERIARTGIWARTNPTSMAAQAAAQPACGQSLNQGMVITSERQASAAGGFSTGVTTTPSGQGFRKTFYKRKLPSPPSTPFASPEGRQLFAEALASGHMNGFFKLMEQFSTQDEPSFCGLASLAMVLNALAIDPRRTWKGAWRWFHEQMLDCCRPLDDVKREGITLSQAACLARCNGARVVLHRYGTFTLDELRQQVLDVCSSGDQHLVVSYSRRTFLQTGDGHFSPIGGYHKEKDLVLILDVARFKYPPHWVPVSMLYEAMQYIDPVTQQPRGFLRMSAQPLLSSILLTLDVRSSCWQEASSWVRNAAPTMLRETAALDKAPPLEQVVSSLLAALPTTSLDAFLMLRQNCITQGPGNSLTGSADAENGCGTVVVVGGPRGDGTKQVAVAAAGEPPERCLPVGAQQQLLNELRALPLFTMVQDVMRNSGQLQACTQLTCDQADTTHSNLDFPSPTAQPHHQQHDISTQSLNEFTSQSDSTPITSIAQLLQQLSPDSQREGPRRATQHVNSGYLAEKATALLLLVHEEGSLPSVWHDSDAGRAWHALMDTSGMTIVEAELAFLRQQWMHVDEVIQSGSVETKCTTGCTQKLDCAVLKC